MAVTSGAVPLDERGGPGPLLAHPVPAQILVPFWFLFARAPKRAGS
jgi:hypothetical protein